jgi:hypothetical protein
VSQFAGEDQPGGVAQDVAPIAYQFFRMANKQPGMFDRSRAEHAAKATRSLRISNGNRLPAAETSIPAVFHRKSILSALLALIFLSFFGTLTLSASMSPQSYDWRYSVISHLLSPRDNPSHYRLAAGGLALTGLLMLPFAGYLRRQLGMIAPRVAAGLLGKFSRRNCCVDLRLLCRTATHSRRPADSATA